MRNDLNKIIIAILLNVMMFSLQANDLLPSESFYINNIAVNEIVAASPGDKGDPNIGPGGSGDGQTGDGGWVGAEDAPVGEANIPFLAAGLIYACIIFYKKRIKRTAY